VCRLYRPALFLFFIIFCTVLFLFSPVFCADGIHISAILEIEGTLNTKDLEAQKIELLFEPEIKAELPNSWNLTSNARLRADAVDELEPGTPIQSERSSYSQRLTIGDQVDIELQELFVQRYFGDTFLKAGKQQIVWGQADGLKVLDVVNPQDFREFILDDFADSRIPLWSVSLEFPVNDVNVQLVWVPDRTYHDIPEINALFAFTAPQLMPSPAPGIATVINQPDRPGRFVKDADAGFRLSTFWEGWDLAFSYFYHYSDVPVLYQSLSFPSGMPTVTVSPEYKRSHMVGFSFSNAFGDFTLRGETAYFSDRYSLADLNQDPDGIVNTGEIAYVVGLDWQGLTDTFLSVQLFQSILTSHSSGLVRDRIENNITLFIKRELMNITFVPQCIWLHNINLDDGLIRPLVSYELQDNVNIWMGSDIFYGSSEGIFGQFDRNDRIVFGAEIGI
jgi:hypothetical protein